MFDVSVVMPSFNQGEFIAEAARSVLEQPGPATELVVVDGGSTDDTLQVLSMLAAQHPGRLRWSSRPDKGPADAVSTGVARASAPVIGWLNSDDLYAPGAIQKAHAHLSLHPSQVMVYGQGEHVDATGRFIEPYPSLPPSTPVQAFVDGCFICQPTAFFRKEAFEQVGGLDLGLGASFDFDLWLKVFKQYPGRIGFVDEVLARTRLHASTITSKFRERVAMEGMAVIARHLGPPPAHWLLTHFSELFRQHPFQPHIPDLRQHGLQLIDRAGAWVTPAVQDHLATRLATDPRLALAPPGVAVGIDEDGWAPESLELRLLQGATPTRAWLLKCRNDTPDGARLTVRVTGPEGHCETTTVEGRGSFELRADVGDLREGARLVYRIDCEGGFIPAELDMGSTDRRRLALRVEQLSLFD